TVKVIAFDKTGTLTVGKPEVTTVRLFNGDEESNAKAQRRKGATDDPLRPGVLALSSETDLLRLAAAVEARSEHPLAKSVVTEAEKRGITIPEVTHFQSVAGLGVRGSVHDPAHGKTDIHTGNPRYFANFEGNSHLAAVTALVNELEEEGQTSVIIAQAAEGLAVHFLGIIGMADAIRPDTPAVVRELKAAGVERV